MNANNELTVFFFIAEFGDTEFSRLDPETTEEFVLLPKAMTSNDLVSTAMLQQVMSEHHNHAGMPPPIAESQYITTAMMLDGYGVECYPAKVGTKRAMSLSSFALGARHYP